MDWYLKTIHQIYKDAACLDYDDIIQYRFASLRPHAIAKSRIFEGCAVGVTEDLLEGLRRLPLEFRLLGVVWSGGGGSLLCFRPLLFRRHGGARLCASYGCAVLPPAAGGNLKKNWRFKFFLNSVAILFFSRRH